MKKLLLIFGLLLFSCVEKIVAPPEEEGPEFNYVTCSVYQFSVKYVNGEPYVTAKGKVKNHGPGPVWAIRVLVTTNWGGNQMTGTIPSALEEGEIADWKVGPVLGTYIKNKYPLYSE